MQGENTVRATIYQSHLWRFRGNLIEQERDFVAVEEIFFGDDYDWRALEVEKVIIDSVDFEVKPAYNFTNMAAYGQGVITSDFPVYVNFFISNTAEEKGQVRNWAKYLSGSSARGHATTGVKSKYDGRWYKTVVAQAEGAEASVKITQKENGTTTIDNWTLYSDNVVLQKGRVVVYVKLSDFKIQGARCITAGNAPKEGEKSPDEDGDGSGNGNGMLRTNLLHYLRRKAGKPEIEKKEEVVKTKKDTRRIKRNPAPGDDDIEQTPTQFVPYTKFDPAWIEDPLIKTANGDKELILDFVFWVETTFKIRYTRGTGSN